MEEEEAEEESVDVGCEERQVEDHRAGQLHQQRNNGVEQELERSKSQKQQNWGGRNNLLSSSVHLVEF